MADMIAPSLVPASPLDAMSDLRAETLRIASLPQAARFSLRLRRAEGFPAAASALGLELPRDACRFNEAGGRRAVWLGPDEWALAAPLSEGPEIAAAVSEALRDVPHSLTEVGHRSVAVAVEGADAAALLNAGCPLDLSPRAFPVGMATRTVLAKTEIVLLRTGEARFEVEVWRSFAAYALGFLREAARDFA